MQQSVSTNFEGQRSWFQFLMEAKESFNIEIVVAQGTISVEVYTDPTNLAESVWSLEPVSAGTYNIRVRSGDPRFHLGTKYYLSGIQINSVGGSSFAVQVV